MNVLFVALGLIIHKYVSDYFRFDIFLHYLDRYKYIIPNTNTAIAQTRQIYFVQMTKIKMTKIKITKIQKWLYSYKYQNVSNQYHCVHVNGPNIYVVISLIAKSKSVHTT